MLLIISAVLMMTKNGDQHDSQFFFLLGLYWKWWSPQISEMIDVLVEYWVGKSLQVSSWEQVGIYCQSTAARHICQVNHRPLRMVPEAWLWVCVCVSKVHGWYKQSSFEELLNLINVSDELLSVVLKPGIMSTKKSRENSNAVFRRIRGSAHEAKLSPKLIF